MKKIITLLLLCLGFTAYANRTFEKLTEVNKCWTEQSDIKKSELPAYTLQSETDWIATHLMLVEKTLRERSTAHLSESQRANREMALDRLNEYWHSRSFPINEDYSYRTPIFIDNHDNFCAVGYLVKATGYEHVSRMIAANTNLAYVREMKYPELFAWANEYGFTVDELAWIQPGYPPAYYAEAVGRGTDGEVMALHADNANGKLYVGGEFSMVDNTITANNIAYVTQSGETYTWHSMGTGVNGTVKAIQVFDNKVFVAGSFNQAGGVNIHNIAYWDGSAWHNAGCLNGEVRDLVVYNNELYAIGKFDVCAALSEVNVAKWISSSNMWGQMPALSGEVNTAEVVGDNLVIGGYFTYNGNQENIIKYNSSTGFQTYAGNIKNEVKDIEMFKGSLYAACKQVDITDSGVVQMLKGNTWGSIGTFHLDYTSDVSVNTICAQEDSLMAGGDFTNTGMMIIGSGILHCLSVSHPSGGFNAPWFTVDSAINTMAVFNGRLIAGGKFKYGYGQQPTTLNGICYKKPLNPVSASNISSSVPSFNIYPNPAHSGAGITIESSVQPTLLRITDMNGKLIAEKQLKGNGSIQLPQISAGTYMAEISDKQGNISTSKLVVQ